MCRSEDARFVSRKFAAPAPGGLCFVHPVPNGPVGVTGGLVRDNDVGG